jgi:hypothetical protein
MSERNLYYLHELSDYKVASDYPDVRGWDIKDAVGKVIGKVDGLLVNKKAKRVVYLDVEVNASIIEEGHTAPQSVSDGVHEFINKEGEDHLIVPIGLVEIFEDEKYVQSNDISYDMFKNTKRFSKGGMFDRDYEISVNRQYLPYNSVSDGVDNSDDFYDRKEFQSRYKNQGSLLA